MKVTLNNREWDFDVNGTVGIQWKAQLIAGRDIDFKDVNDHMYLVYAAYYGSNKEPMEFDKFLGCLTSEPYTAMLNYFWQRWRELEPAVAKAAEELEKADEKND